MASLASRQPGGAHLSAFSAELSRNRAPVHGAIFYLALSKIYKHPSGHWPIGVAAWLVDKCLAADTFAAMEEPHRLVDDIRAFFRPVRAI